MENEKSPHMSVIITTASGYESIQTVIRHLKKQTVKDTLEIIIIAPPIMKAAVEEAEVGDFKNTIFIEADIDSELYQAWVDAVNRSSAPIVAFGENHAFPEPGWAEALIEAHKGQWAAVGSVIINANPDSMKSWAQYFMTYGRWAEPLTSGETDDLPGHNSSYKRSVLLEYGDDLKTKLIRTNIMHADLRSRGYRLYMDSEARIKHINVSKTISIILDMAYNGRLYTASLVHNKRWSPMQRFLNAAIEPLIMLKYFRGTLHNIRRTGHWNKLIPTALPIIILGLTAHFIGKLLGYAAGFGNVQQKINSYEFDRSKHVTEQEKSLL